MRRTLELSRKARRERRRAHRTTKFDEVYFRGKSKRSSQRGVLVSISDSGVALLVERGMAPKEEAKLTPLGNHRLRGWKKPAIVMRVEELSDKLDLVAATYPEK